LENLTPLGFQAHFLDGSKSILLFHHNNTDCNTTVAIPLYEVLDLIPNYFSRESAILSASCRGLCLTDSKLEPCDNAACRNSLVRQYIRSLYEKKHTEQ
jgi:hypothetical protein